MKLKVVVIDDNSFDRMTICDSLVTEGYDVIEADNGVSGLDIIKKESPDLIICDLKMPVMNGDELLDELRNSCTDMDIIPFIFISGYADGQDRIDRLKKGADNCFEKPVDLELFRMSHIMSHSRDAVRIIYVCCSICIHIYVSL